MNRKNQGLTLVEVLVSVAVLSILIVSIYTVFKSGMDAWSKSDTRLEIFQNARFVLDQMSRELPGAFVDAGADAAFTGTYDSDTLEYTLEFVTTIGDSVYKLKYWLDVNILKRGYIENPPDYTNTDYGDSSADEPDGINEATIDFSDMVSDIRFLYWKTGVTTDWDTGAVDSWAESTLPAAVKVKIELQDQNNNVFPFETVVYLPNSG